MASACCLPQRTPMMASSPPAVASTKSPSAPRQRWGWWGRAAGACPCRVPSLPCLPKVACPPSSQPAPHNHPPAATAPHLPPVLSLSPPCTSPPSLNSSPGLGLLLRQGRRRHPRVLGLTVWPPVCQGGDAGGGHTRHGGGSQGNQDQVGGWGRWEEHRVWGQQVHRPTNQPACFRLSACSAGMPAPLPL